MISVTKLLFAREYFGDSLRYTGNAHSMRNGAAEGMGPVVVWNSTRTCNLKCRHCYMSSDARKYQDELTTEEAKRFIDDLADFRVPVLLFSGGEPLIRPDFFELAEYAGRKGVRPTLSTNGTLITREVAQRIKDLGVGYVGISLDGLRDVNDKFRGVEGAYEKAMQGIENCVAVGQRVGLRFTINHHNILELERIFDFIEEKNINRVNQPEDLNDYIRVTTPSVWIVLIAIALILVAILGWMVFGTVEVHEDNGSVTEAHPITYVIN